MHRLTAKLAETAKKYDRVYGVQNITKEAFFHVLMVSLYLVCGAAIAFSIFNATATKPHTHFIPLDATQVECVE